MRIFDRLAELIPADAVVEEVSVGIFWTFVKTQYGSGMSATAHRWYPDPPGALIPFSGSIQGMKVLDLVSLYDSESLPARALANAAVSASFSSSEMTGARHSGRAQDLIEVLCAHRERHIALIGHFHFAEELLDMNWMFLSWMAVAKKAIFRVLRFRNAFLSRIWS